MRCKVLDKWEEMDILETEKKQWFMLGQWISWKTLLKKKRKEIINSKHVLAKFLEKYWCPGTAMMDPLALGLTLTGLSFCPLGT